MIGDSVNLRAQDYLTKAIPGIQIDAVVSRQLENGMKVFETDISNKVLLKNVVIALGTNTVSNYKELLDQYVEKLPKGRRLILVKMCIRDRAKLRSRVGLKSIACHFPSIGTGSF